MITMKLVKFNADRLGALQKDGSVIDLNYAYAAYAKNKGAARPQALADAKVPSNLHAFILEGETGLGEAKKALNHVKKGDKSGPKGEKIHYMPDEVKIHAPLPSMGNKIAMAGANFYDHSLDAGRSLRGDTTTTIDDLKEQVAKGEYRAWGFWKQAICVIGPDSETPYPSRTQRLDYEVEVAAVIGKQCKDVKEEEAAELIYGYTILNDLSIRDGGGGQGPDGFFYAKNFEGSAPMGPCIVTADEVKDVYKLGMKQWVNGELRQNGSMKSIIRGFDWWLAYLSRDMPFRPGDMICGGTCSGTAMDQTPRVNGRTDPKLFLKPGDELEAWIEGIGTLKTKIVPKQ
jgi:2-keto-4-pentenoate hydratase/2-oxohepta-3-ene-1,7-dioic acid hydratase in catechol pathway